MNRKKLAVIAFAIAAVVIAVVVTVVVLVTRSGKDDDNTIKTCDQAQNALLPFCDSRLPIDTRIQDLVSRLTVQEKIGLLVNRAAGASMNVELDPYNWWNEALHGVGQSQTPGNPNLGTYFRPPTEHSTVFPQIISLSTSFDKDLFFQMANVTGNEARAFYNAGNSGLTFWSPNINIYRDPRWGRGQETPGEDPYLSAEFARLFIKGLQGDEEKTGFIKASACCKHFAAHSIEENRHSFDAVVTEQDLADTYLPAFKTCVDNNVTSIMTAYSAINGIPATAHKHFITNVIREQWGFDGYIVSDCAAVDDVIYNHNYTQTESETCFAVLDAGVDVECGSFYTQFLQGAVDDGLVTEKLMDTALSRGFRVLMRLGYFEKDDTRPFKNFLPEDIDTEPHKQLSLEAARRSIVLLKNNVNELTTRPTLPLNEQDFGPSGASMALIGPHLNAEYAFLGVYHGIPSSIKVPLYEIENYVPNLQWERGCEVNSFDNSNISEAENLARTSSQVVLFVGINSDNEAEFGDRPDISLTGLQPELISRVLNVAKQPVILFVMSGGALDLSAYKNDPRVGAIVWAGYIGQSGGAAIADVLFGNYNPSGRLSQTFYDSSFLEQISKQDMNMRPMNGSPGRTYRFYTGEPVYPFGFGLSYTTFEYSFSSGNTEIPILQFENDCVNLGLVVRNAGQRSGDHSVLWFLAPPNAGLGGRPIKNLVEFEKLQNIQPSESREIHICLRSDMFQLADEEGEFQVVTGEWALIVGNVTRTIIVGEEYTSACDKPRNAPLLFCDSQLSIDTRVQDLVSRLTVQEKIGLLVNRAAGASVNLELDPYNWWNEALHGVGQSQTPDNPNLGTYFRPPTEHSTVFPQIISLSTSFDKDLFFQMANVTGNEARAFYNAGNSGLTFWSPNINIYRDPRWGRGQETPGEDPYLSAEFARIFINGLQGDEEKTGFIKASACCKHFAAHSIEENRHSFDAVVTEQDLADTYLPAFKTCVDNNVTSIMTAYSAINGIPATAHKHFITNVIREQWGFDGYIVSDCDAVDDVIYNHNYTQTESETCFAVLDAGVDVECGRFYTQFLQGAVNEGLVTEELMDTALSRGFRVLMRLGYFEKDDTRPFKDFLPKDVDTEPHKQLSLEAARRSIVLLKNNLNEVTARPTLPLSGPDFGPSGASMALIGPHLNAEYAFLGVYHGIPSSIKVPLDEIQSYVPDLKWERGCEVNSFDNANISDAENLARTSSQVVLFVGINSENEAEFGDRPDISLTGLQPELISRVLDVAQQPVILFVMSGGALDLSAYKNDPRVGAIVWAGYIGQSGGAAIADVLFGNYNPSGRLTQTFYDSSFLEQISKQDMNMRPVNGSPGRTYRFYTGEPVYPFGFGLSYTNFEYSFPSGNDDIEISQSQNDCVDLGLVVRNAGQRSGDHSVLWFLAPPNAGQGGQPIKNLVEFEKLQNIQPSESREIQICLRSDMFQLANEQGEVEIVLGEWTLIVGDQTKRIIVQDEYSTTCDRPRNTFLPFCDSSLSIDTRVQDLITRLTAAEKIGLLINRAVGASENVELPYYNWWNEALHGVAGAVNPPNSGAYFRPPTEYATVFPQIISLSSSFDRDLFFRMANTTGNEARAFFNAGNSGLTFWSPNINIYRDPRWGRGQETPGEDPYLSAEYARVFIKGLQGNEAEDGFIKVSACCKHFAAHSIEENRNYFNAVVNEQDMADTYLPAFKACVESNVTSIMTAYSAINGIPATVHKHYITDVIREQWGFDGYIVTDCWAVDDVIYHHNYTDTESDTCLAVLDAGVDVECGDFYTRFLQDAINEGFVTEELMNTALTRGFRVLMRLGYFEKDGERPYKQLLPEIVDSEPNKQLSLEAARRSIVLLKNNQNEISIRPTLPLNEEDFGTGRSSMALIGPHLNASTVFLGNYHGIPSSIKIPLNEIQRHVPDLEWESGCEISSFDNDNIDEAVELARASSQVVLFVGINSEIEAEYGDRPDISLPGLQSELILRVLDVVQQPVILFVVSGGAIDLSVYKNDPRVGAIVWAGYIGQSGGEAIADVLFGNYNPSGRLTQTFYDSSYLEQISKQNMNMRPVNGSPGRTYRFYTEEPVYPFGFGLSYTTFEYSFSSGNTEVLISQFENDCIELGLVVQNSGQSSGDHSVLFFVAPPNAGQGGRPIKNLVEFEKLHNVEPSESREIQICLRTNMFQLANEQGEVEIILGEWTLVVGDQTRTIVVHEGTTCGKPRNAPLPFCDSRLPMDTRVQDLVSRLTVQEKIGLLVNRAAGASVNVEMDPYNWWNEALHGVGQSQTPGNPNLGTYFRPPTEHSTVFPQIISLSTSFDKDLFFQMATVTGNEARAFYNAGNSGLTFWSPNINIYRDPRWGRGQETPGEDPYLSAEFARLFIRGIQGDEETGFIKASACCKHFAAHSIEENRHSFDAVVTEQDLADTYLPAFKTCVDNNVTSIMTAYSAINGIPATAHKHFITNVIREQWGFDGYIVSDCAAVDDVIYNHNYTQTESETCFAVLDAGVDVECGSFYTKFLQGAVDEGLVTEELMDTALSRGFRVLMRLGYFEKDDTRPFKNFLPEDIDTEPHKQLSLEAARRSIVLLKNNVNELTTRPTLPLNEQDFGPSGVSMALIGPHLNAEYAFLGVYHGVPSSIKVPLYEIENYVPDLQWERGCEVNSFDNSNISEAEDLARTSSQVVLFVGINSDNEAEFGDRPNISLTGLQPELISRVLDVAQQPVILFVMSGGGLDLSAYKNDPRVGAIVWAGYIGQSGGAAIADVLFGNYNPSGRLTQTFYDSSFLEQISKQDMNMRPINGSPGRTYRFYTGEPVYPFGFGLSYTTFEYSFSSGNTEIPISQFENDCVDLGLVVRNAGQRSGDHSVLWFLAPPNAGQGGRPIKNLVEFEKLQNIQPSESREIQICLRGSMFQLANEQGEFEIILGNWTVMVGDQTRSIIVT